MNVQQKLLSPTCEVAVAGSRKFEIQTLPQNLKKILVVLTFIFNPPPFF